jgi:hypothetical protein
MSQPYRGELLIGPCPICGKEARTDTDTVIVYEDGDDPDPAHLFCALAVGGGVPGIIDHHTGEIHLLGVPEWDDTAEVN